MAVNENLVIFVRLVERGSSAVECGLAIERARIRITLCYRFGREGGREGGGREGGRAGRREGRREGGREGGREGMKVVALVWTYSVVECFQENSNWFRNE